MGLFGSLGLEYSEADRAARSVTSYLDPRRIQAGSVYTAYLAPGARLERVVFFEPGVGEVEAVRTGGDWLGAERRYRVDTRRATVSGRLEGPLESSLRAAGAPGQLAYRLADVLQWDLDFNRDLREGDRFRILYDQVWIEGELSRVGDIHAVLYENRGSLIEAYEFGDSGYYDGEGRPLRKQFLRSPLPFSRVTSRFTNRRFHPILKVYRPHLGVDYGAPTGTPVRATANGRVASVRRTKGGGKTVEIRHPNDYRTAYLHLSRYAEGLRSGRRVKQGEVIGFVGATGLATAPHLDYRVKKAGRWINPLSLPNEPAPALSRERLGEYFELQSRLRAGVAYSRFTREPAGAQRTAGP